MPAKAKLGRYRAKRKFGETPEPRGGATAAGGQSFVVQKHAARRLHYDFRLEMDGVLKSWAVVKGPSLDPADKRLAVHVEDHPLEYGAFEGTIPQGQYGGGTVMIWDRGEWSAEGDPHAGYRKGHLKFTLSGERMKGGWSLIAMGGRARATGKDNWLLIKTKDRFAKPGKGTSLIDKATTSVASGRSMTAIETARRGKVWQSPKAQPAPKKIAPRLSRTVTSKRKQREACPDFVPPALATLVEAPPQGKDWLHEIKIDGYRIYARRKGGEVALLTRTGLDWTRRFPTIARSVAALRGGDLALDGEVAVLDEAGKSSFAALQAALKSGETAMLRYIVFDLLYDSGRDLRGEALIDRKNALQARVKSARIPIVYSDHVEAQGSDMFRHACQMALEGVVSKRADQPYHEGRTRDWLKSKCVTRQEFAIIGFTKSKAQRGIGSLALGYYEDEALRYAGRVGTGFDAQQARDLAVRLRPLITKVAPVAKLPSAARRGVTWVAPELVCEVEFLNWTTDGVLRHPSFQGLREDKPADSIRRDRPLANASASRDTVAGVWITHPDRVVFPEIGLTKRGLAEYYQAVGDWILPHIENRPLSLLRCPTGIAGTCFFQKHFATGLTSLHRVPIKERTGMNSYVVVRDLHDLVALIQEGIVEIHPWGSTADDPDRPDRIIFDFDPAPEIAFASVIDAARAMRGYLSEMNTESFVKTTGGKGLHVVAPLRRGLDWTELKAFAHKIASVFVESAPERFTLNPLKRARTGKIFIDYLRNDRGATAVAPYSVRARRGAPVAMPIDWRDLKPSIAGAHFSATSVPAFLAARKRDPWAAMTTNHQSLAGARRALGLAA